MVIDKKPSSLDQFDIPSPCYVLEERLLHENLQTLKNIADRTGIKFLCALKGFAMWSTFPLLSKYLDGATASSLNEALLCYEEFNKKAHLCAPVYIEEEYDKIISISSHITFNSFGQFQKYVDKAAKKGLKIALRINPEFSEVTPEIYNPCSPGSRLGIDISAFPRALPESVSGLHFHTHCEQDAGSLKKTLKVIEKKWGGILDQITWINMGGGLLITRSNFNINLLVEIINAFRARHNNLEVFVEPGEAIGWQTGFLVSTVQDIVKSNNTNTAMLDISFSAHMPDTLEMPYKPEVWNALEASKDLHNYRMGGLTCLAGDFIGDYGFKKPLSIGDRIVFDDMIHYTIVKSNTFNGVKLPSIGIIKENGQFELIRSFGYEDYKNRLS
jgi:carboxynorspermidine decarboxylase